MQVLYLMGAGRSGTTLLATVLGESSQIVTLGELNQFLDYLIENKRCSCAQHLSECEFWRPVVTELLTRYTIEELMEINEYQERTEAHSNIVPSFFIKKERYIKFQKELFDIIYEANPGTYFLDSSKYISRCLQLRRTKGMELKVIYTVRDVRGVINSFGKKVQTSKSPASTILYYSLINFFGQLFYWRTSKKDVMKLRYEDFVSQPTQSIQNIASFVQIPLDDIVSKLDKQEQFIMPHIIGGNRMKNQSKIRLRNDDAWKIKMSRTRQLAYYLLTAPFMLINRYRL